MATHQQTEPSLQCLESSRHVFNSNGVNLITPLSIGDSYISSTTTSDRLTFSCHTKTNSNGNLLFPLAEKAANTTNYTRKMSWQNFLKYLSSQRIVKNIGIFKNFKTKPKYYFNTQQFPVKETTKKMEQFPYRNNLENYLNDFTNIHCKGKGIKYKKLILRMKFFKARKTFPYKYKMPRKKSVTKLKVKTIAKPKFSLMFKQHSNTKRPLKLQKNEYLKRFYLKRENYFQNDFHSLDRNEGKHLNFPAKISKTHIKFPFTNKSKYETNLNLIAFKENFQTNQIFNTLQNSNVKEQNKQILITKLPCEMTSLYCISKFPLNNGTSQHAHSLSNNLGNYAEVNICKSSITSNSLASSSMTLDASNTDTGHVFQVHAIEKARSLTTFEKTHPPPHAAISTIINNDHEDVHKLADTNSINKTRPNEVGYYAEKIERLQDAIIYLFEKIQNSLKTNHNYEHESTNAAEQDHGEGNIRFALTPPTIATTSVQNIESKNVNKEALYEKFDLGDLCGRQFGDIVECSDVRDTLTETVDNGVSKEQTKSTGGFLVKSEEAASPNTLILNPLNQSAYTSQEYNTCTNTSELLPKNNVFAVNEENNVDIRNNSQYDPADTVHKQNKSNEITSTTILGTLESNSASAETNEMTVERFKKKEQENINFKNSLDNILESDQQVNEMKYEMHKVKGSLPNTASERSLGKHDNIKTPTGNRLPHVIRPTNNNDNSYTSRISIKNDRNGLMIPKRASLTTPLLQEGIKNRSVISTPSFNDFPASRTALNSIKPSNDPVAETLSPRRPSLGSLRNTQSTSLLSADLPRYAPLTAANQADHTTLVNRTASIDSSLSDVLPERTRLRRQRRLKAQDSQDDTEDPIERLNRLKARISASLSEVKGVLKQYSTEAENENHTAPVAASVQETKEDGKKEGPVTFRFVKKIRRRSLFCEDDEEVKQETDKSKEAGNYIERQQQGKDETDNCKFDNSAIVEVCNEKFREIENEGTKPTPLETNEMKPNTNLYTLKEEIQECTENNTHTVVEKQQSFPDEPKIIKEEPKGAIPKLPITPAQNQSESDNNSETCKKIKRKIIIKPKEPLRRASLAAVEGSKIEPPVKVAVPAKIQRRPSDSEAVVKKKLITAKLNTSGAVEEVTPKPKILKVKKLSLKNNNNSQLASTQTKLQEEETTLKTVNVKSDDHVKPLRADNSKSIHNNENKDVLMPRQLELEKQQQEQQVNTEITRQTNLLLPTQLVIDEEASLNEKTITNSVLPPRLQQQQRQQEQHATIKSTATNFKANDLQAKGAMLENLTTVLSSSTATEESGQITRESVVQPEDFHDLLQQETALVQTLATNAQNENKVESIQSKLAPENLEGIQTAAKEQTQNSAKPNQQVITTTDVALIKSDDDYNKHEDIKANTSLKEPCTDKTTTSTHVEAEAETDTQQRKDEQSVANIDATKTKSSPHNSISCTSDITPKTTTASFLPTESAVEKKAEVSANQQNKMPERQLAPAPVQTADINPHPEHHKKKIIIKKIIRQPSVDKAKKAGPEKPKAPPEAVNITNEISLNQSQPLQELEESKPTQKVTQVTNESPLNKTQQLEKSETTQKPAQVTTELSTNRIQLQHELERSKPPEKEPLDKAELLQKLEKATTPEPTKVTTEQPSNKSQLLQETKEVVSDSNSNAFKAILDDEPISIEAPPDFGQEELAEESSELTEVSESSASIDSEEVSGPQKAKKERRVKKKVIIKRQKRRLSIGDNFFHPSNDEQSQNSEIETLEKPISYVTDEEAEHAEEKDEEAKNDQEPEEEKKPLKSCILRKEYNIGDEVLYAERFKKTQIKWRRGRVKERITSISYLLDIDGKDVSSHINYLKKYTGRKVSFGGKEYLEIDYEQLAEEEEKAEKLQRRTFSIWNMV